MAFSYQKGTIVGFLGTLRNGTFGMGHGIKDNRKIEQNHNQGGMGTIQGQWQLQLIRNNSKDNTGISLHFPFPPFKKKKQSKTKVNK